jgi:hypothetical protein
MTYNSRVHVSLISADKHTLCTRGLSPLRLKPESPSRAHVPCMTRMLTYHIVDLPRYTNDLPTWVRYMVLLQQKKRAR